MLALVLQVHFINWFYIHIAKDVNLFSVSQMYFFFQFNGASKQNLAVISKRLLPNQKDEIFDLTLTDQYITVVNVNKDGKILRMNR